MATASRWTPFVVAGLVIVLSALGGYGLRSWIERRAAKKLLVGLVDINDAEGVSWALRAGADSNMREDDSGYSDTVLHLAVAKGHRQCISALLAAGADIDTRNSKGHTPLHLAAMYCRPGAAEILIESGADIHAKDNFSQQTPTHWASERGCASVLEQLIAAGADVNLADGFGDTPFLLGVHDAVVGQLLINAGANIDVRDDAGQSALHKCHSDLIRVLVTKGIPVDVKTKKGHTPLHDCATAGITEALKTLIDLGADVNATLPDGTTPLHLAASQGNVECIRILLESGADISAEDKKGRQPADRALNSKTRSFLKGHAKHNVN